MVEPHSGQSSCSCPRHLSHAAVRRPFGYAQDESRPQFHMPSRRLHTDEAGPHVAMSGTSVPNYLCDISLQTPSGLHGLSRIGIT